MSFDHIRVKAATKQFCETEIDARVQEAMSLGMVVVMHEEAHKEGKYWVASVLLGSPTPTLQKLPTGSA